MRGGLRRGLTLIELLLSLGLLAMLASTAATLIQMTGAAATGHMRDRQFAVSALLDLIGTDLLCEDEQTDEPRISIADGALSIRTRFSGQGAVTHEYSLDRSQQIMVLRQVNSEDGAVTRDLLKDVEEFRCSIDPKAARLTITIGFVVHRNNFDQRGRLSRSYRLP